MPNGVPWDCQLVIRRGGGVRGGEVRVGVRRVGFKIKKIVYFINFIYGGLPSHDCGVAPPGVRGP